MRKRLPSIKMDIDDVEIEILLYALGALHGMYQMDSELRDKMAEDELDESDIESLVVKIKRFNEFFIEVEDAVLGVKKGK